MKKLSTAVLLALVFLSVPVLAESRIAVNDDWTIKAGGSQEEIFNLISPTRVRIDVFGTKYAEKGFTVFFSDEGNETTKSFHRVTKLGPGAHILRVTNSENLLHRVTVRVFVALDGE